MSSQGHINVGRAKTPTTGSPNVIVALVIPKLNPVTSIYNKTDFHKSSRNSWLLLLSLKMGASPGGYNETLYLYLWKSLFMFLLQQKMNNNGVQEEYTKETLSQKKNK